MRAHDKSGERKKEAPCPGNAWRSLTGRPHAPGKTTVTGAGNGDVSGADGCLFVDIMPAAAGKGLALTYVRQTLFGMLADDCLVAGDSGNDVAMFQGDVERGIMVRIATPSASYWGACAHVERDRETERQRETETERQRQTHTLSLSRTHTNEDTHKHSHTSRWVTQSRSCWRNAGCRTMWPRTNMPRGFCRDCVTTVWSESERQI